jgi:predicted nuclease of restriction endonuclease-like RecB superfamily
LLLKTEELKELDLRRLRDPAPTKLLKIYNLTLIELSKYNA